MPASHASGLRNHQLRAARRLIIVEGTLGALVNQFTAGIFVVKFGIELGASPREIAVLQAVPQFVSALQIFASWFLNHTGEPRRVVLLFQFLQRTVWMSVGLSALFLLKPGVHGPVWMLIVANGIAALSTQMALVAWYAWVSELAPVSFWGRFLGRRQMIALLFATPVGIGAGLFADWWFKTHPDDLTGIGGMTAFGAGLGYVGWAVLSRVPAVTVHRSGEPLRFDRVLARALADASFRRLALTRCWIMFFVQVAAPMWQFYALNVLHVPLWTMKTFEGVGNATSAGGNRLCGKLADRFGYRPVAILFCVGMGTIPIWWTLASSVVWRIPLGSVTLTIPCYWIAVLSPFIGNFCWAGVNLCASNLALKLAEREHRAAYVALFQGAFGVTGGLGALLGGFLVDAARKQLPAEQLAVAFQIVFLLSALGRWVAMIGLSSVREPGATPTLKFARTFAREVCGRAARLLRIADESG